MVNGEFLKSSATKSSPTTPTTSTSLSEPVKTGDRLSLGSFPSSLVVEETLVVDDRQAVRPAQLVENKLSSRLKEASLPVSHLQMRGLLRSR